MLTLSILWLILATSVTVIATFRKRVTSSNDVAAEAPPASGRAAIVLAAAYGFVLLAGFLYLGWRSLELML